MVRFHKTYLVNTVEAVNTGEFEITISFVTKKSIEASPKTQRERGIQSLVIPNHTGRIRDLDMLNLVLPLLELPQKILLASKVVKRDSK